MAELRYSVHRGAVPLINPETGSPELRSEQEALRLMQEGWEPEPPEEYRARFKRELLDQPLPAAATGLLRGLTLGGSDVIARAAGGKRVAEHLGQLQAENPAASIIPELIGTVGSFAIPGGPLAQLGKGAAKVGGLATKALGAGKLARAAGTLTAGGLEGAAYGVGAGASSEALNTEDRPPGSIAASILSSAGTGALVGGAVAGGLGAIGGLARHAYGKLKAGKAAAVKAAEESRLEIESLAAKRQSDAANLSKGLRPPEEIQAAKDELSVLRHKMGHVAGRDLAAEVTEREAALANNATLKEQIAQRELSIQEQMAQAAALRADEAAAELAALRAKMPAGPIEDAEALIGQRTAAKAARAALAESESEILSLTERRKLFDDARRLAADPTKKIPKGLVENGIMHAPEYPDFWPRITALANKTGVAVKAGDEWGTLASVRKKLGTKVPVGNLPGLEAAAGLKPGPNTVRRFTAEAEQEMASLRQRLLAAEERGAGARARALPSEAEEELERRALYASSSAELEAQARVLEERIAEGQRLTVGTKTEALRLKADSRKLLTEKQEAALQKEIASREELSGLGPRFRELREKIDGHRALEAQLKALGKPSAREIELEKAHQAALARLNEKRAGFVSRTLGEGLAYYSASKARGAIGAVTGTTPSFFGGGGISGFMGAAGARELGRWFSGKAMGGLGVVLAPIGVAGGAGLAAAHATARGIRAASPTLKRVAYHFSLKDWQQLDSALAQGPDQYEAALRVGLGEGVPADAASAAADAAVAQFRFLYERRPRNPAEAMAEQRGEFYVPVGDWRPTSSELEKYGRYVKAATDPHSVIEDFKALRLTSEAVEALAALRPEVLAGLQAEIDKAVIEARVKGKRFTRLQERQFRLVKQAPDTMWQSLLLWQQAYLPQERKMPPRKPAGGQGAYSSMVQTKLQSIGIS